MRPAVIIIGFYGHGNAGDEAILSAMRQYLGDDLDIIVSSYADHVAMAQLPTYKGLRIVKQADRAAVTRGNVCGVIVGGGGLGIGFGTPQMLMAASQGVPLISLGCSIHERYLPEQKVYRAFLEINRLYDYINVRDRHSKGVLAHYGLDCDVGTDLVYALDPEPPLMEMTGNDVLLITVRESVVNTQQFTGLFSVLERFALSCGLTIRIVSYCRSEHDRLEKGPYARFLIPERLYNYPSRLKAVAATCALAVSFRRLHAAILPLSEGVPCVMVDPMVRGDSVTKFSTLMRDNELDELYVTAEDGSDGLLRALQRALTYDRASLRRKAELNRQKARFALQRAKETLLDIKEQNSYTPSHDTSAMNTVLTPRPKVPS
jgi:polysaccharide pyruvyl transferase WcaK-like protein